MVQPTTPRLSIDVPLLLGLELVVRDAQRLEVVQFSRSSRREWHDVVELERSYGVIAEGAFLMLPFHDDPLVERGEGHSFDAGNPHGIPELGECASPIDLSSGLCYNT